MLLFLFDLYDFEESGDSRSAGRPVGIGEDVQEDSEEDPETKAERTLRCSNCGHDITVDRERISINDSHEHTFVNPGGYLYRIGCFRRAPGCVQAGELTKDCTWFENYFWRYALCEACLIHLGWEYLSVNVDQGTEGFFGLILDRLIEG